MSERLTKYSKYDHMGRGGIAHVKCYNTCRPGMDCCLCELENEMLKKLAALKQRNIDLYFELNGEIVKLQDELAAYKQAEAERRLIITPFCKDCKNYDIERGICGIEDLGWHYAKPLETCCMGIFKKLENGEENKC